MAEDIEYVIESSGNRFFNLSELWVYRELFYFFTWRDIKVKYKQTMLGFLWAVLQPLFMMLIFTFFFGRALHIPSQGLPYPVFVFSGLLLWNTFSTGLTNASNSMVSNAAIIKKNLFPPGSSFQCRLYWSLCLISSWLLFCFLPLLIYYQQPLSLNALWCWPLALMITLIATLGPGSWLAALNVKYRDFRYVIPFLVQVLFFLTPVIYPVSMLTYPMLQYILVLSPMYAAVELFQASTYRHRT